MKFFQYSSNCHLNKVLKTSAHPSISLVVVLLVTILIIPSFASAEVRKGYYPSGELKVERNYKNGKSEGITKLYYESGELSGEMIFKNGKTMCSKDYNESGNEGSENK